jgi:hypothetical protein
VRWPSEVFSKARDSIPALHAVAEYTRQHSALFVTDGPRMSSTTERNRRRREIEALANQIDELKASAAEGKAKYTEFENILHKLHAAGFYPEISLISAVAKALV